MSTITQCRKCGGTIFSFMRYTDDESPEGWKYDPKKDFDSGSCKCHFGMNILLTGRPGTGKTWVMKQLIEHYELTEKGKVGLIDYVANDSVLVTGNYVGDIFDGCDKLSMAAISSTRDLIYETPGLVRLYDGDRFTNKTFLTYDPIIINIMGDGSEGRAKRGSNQTEARLKAMATRYDNYQYNYRVESSDAAFELVKEIIDYGEELKAPLKNGNGQQYLF